VNNKKKRIYRYICLTRNKHLRHLFVHSCSLHRSLLSILVHTSGLLLTIILMLIYESIEGSKRKTMTTTTPAITTTKRRKKRKKIELSLRV